MSPNRVSSSSVDDDYAHDRELVAVVGMRRKVFDALVQSELGGHFEFAYGGCIDDGSNARAVAERAIAKASIVLLNTKYARKLPSLCCNGHAVLQFRGASSARAQLGEWLSRRDGRRRSA